MRDHLPVKLPHVLKDETKIKCALYSRVPDLTQIFQSDFLKCRSATKGYIQKNSMDINLGNTVLNKVSQDFYNRNSSNFLYAKGYPKYPRRR